MKFLRFVIILPLTSYLLFLCAASVSAQSHPFMLVREDQYSELQSRASQEPWAGMKTRAINECTQRSLPMQPNQFGQNSCNGNLPVINSNEYPSLGSERYCIRAIMSACSLAYILDPPNRPDYVNKVIDTLPFWEDILIVQSGADDNTPAWSTGFLTDATAAYFNSVLAIDILYDELVNQPANIAYSGLSPFTNQLQYAEFLFQQEFNHFYGYNSPIYDLYLKDGSTRDYNAAPNNYPPAREAALIIWKIYTRSFNATDADSRSMLFGGVINNAQSPYPPVPLSGYMPELADRVNNSGVYSEGPGYGYAGWGLDRDERSHLVDVLEFTGKDSEFDPWSDYHVDFYTNPIYQAFYEWLYGYASTPFGLMTSFADTHALRQLSDGGHGGNNWTTSSHIGQAGKFSALAGDYAAWKNQGDPQQGRLLNYLLYQPNLGNSRPSSRLFTNGGAFFLSQPVSDQSLYGALWNTQAPPNGNVFHVRKDVNAIYLAAFGSPLLLNGGFCGASSPAGPDSCMGVDENGVQTRFSGEYLGDRAVSNNILMADYTVGADVTTPNPDQITTNFGLGVTEGFTATSIDYVSADSGAFFPQGDHQRNFVMVHPSQTTQGYFVVFDEVVNSDAANINLVFHPNAKTRQMVTDLTEYSIQVFRTFMGTVDVGLDLFFGTAPDTVQFYRGIIASSSGGAITPEYFFNTYPVNPDGTKQIATVLFPYNNTHPKPPMVRLSGQGYSGVRLDHNPSLRDYVLETNVASPITQNGIASQAKAIIVRMNDNVITQYFARAAVRLTDQNSTLGFTSDQPVSLTLNQVTGNIISPGTDVSFFYPGLTGIRLNGQVINSSPVSHGRQVTILAGTHTLELVTDGTPPPTAPPPPEYDFADLWERVLSFGTTNATLNLLGSSLIDIFDLNHLLSQY